MPAERVKYVHGLIGIHQIVSFIGITGKIEQGAGVLGFDIVNDAMLHGFKHQACAVFADGGYHWGSCEDGDRDAVANR